MRTSRICRFARLEKYERYTRFHKEYISGWRRRGVAVAGATRSRVLLSTSGTVGWPMGDLVSANSGAHQGADFSKSRFRYYKVWRARRWQVRLHRRISA